MMWCVPSPINVGGMPILLSRFFKTFYRFLHFWLSLGGNWTRHQRNMVLFQDCTKRINSVYLLQVSEKRIVTCSEDGNVRVWDTFPPIRQKKKTSKARSRRRKTVVWARMSEGILALSRRWRTSIFYAILKNSAQREIERHEAYQR